MTIEFRTAAKVHLCECGYIIGPGSLYAIRNSKDKLCRECAKAALAERIHATALPAEDPS